MPATPGADIGRRMGRPVDQIDGENSRAGAGLPIASAQGGGRQTLDKGIAVISTAVDVGREVATVSIGPWIEDPGGFCLIVETRDKPIRNPF